MTLFEKLKQGYAQLLGVSAEVMDKPGVTFAVTTRRHQPEWANYVFPIWLFALADTLVCSVAPEYAAPARIAFAQLAVNVLLRGETLTRAQSLIAAEPTAGREWVQCELFFYPYLQPPALSYHGPQSRPSALGSPGWGRCHLCPGRFCGGRARRRRDPGSAAETSGAPDPRQLG